MTRAFGYVVLVLVTSCTKPTEPTRDSPEPTSKGPSPSSTPTSRPAPTSRVDEPPVVLDDATVHALALSPDGEKAVRTLAATKTFGGWAVGAAGSPTPGVAALRVVWKEKNAGKALALVLEKGTLEGRLMALAGLYDVDAATFQKELARFENEKGDAHVLTSGCDPSGEVVPVAKVVRRDGAVLLDGPTDTLSKWSERHPKQPIEFDIAGGGYTSVMRPR